MTDKFTIFEMNGREYWFAGKPAAADALLAAIPADAFVEKRPRAGSVNVATCRFERRDGQTITVRVDRSAVWTQAELDAMGAGSTVGFNDGPAALAADLNALFAGGAR